MILLLGYGISNKSISKYLDTKSIAYQIYDDVFNKSNIDFDRVELIIKSGSIKNSHFVIEEANKRKIKIISDIEYFYKCYDKNREIIVVTGTNGKSTTVSLIKNIIGKGIDLGGNIGTPLFDFIKSKNNIIIESSSYMNEYIDEFKAKYYCITNIYPNHLEHHGSLKEYIKCKMNLLKNIGRHDYLIYNDDNELVKRMVENLECYKIPFSIKNKVLGVYINKSNIYFNQKKIIDLNEIPLLGKHNLENVMASIAVCYCYDIPVADIQKGVQSFTGIEHRLEKFLKKDNVDVYNDSKATNFQAMKNAIASFKNKNLLLICGGEKKNDDITILDSEIDKIKKVIVCGENKEELGNYFIKKNKDVEKYDSLDEALKHKNDFFNNDIDTILFSPGSPSFDQFENFEARGRFFKKSML